MGELLATPGRDCAIRNRLERPTVRALWLSVNIARDQDGRGGFVGCYTFSRDKTCATFRPRSPSMDTI